MRRIAIIGTTGSGKSSLAQRLAQMCKLSHTELDSLHWLPGWKERDPESFRALVERETSATEWVIDGGYSEVRDLVWGRADTIVWLNYSFPRTAWRLLWRTLRRNIDKQPVCNGNVESWRQTFSKDSILVWLLKSFWRNRRTFPSALKVYGTNKRVLVFRAPDETEAWLRSLE